MVNHRETETGLYLAVQRGVLCCTLWFAMAAIFGGAGFANPVISEIHYDPVSETQRVEFVELQNTSGNAINLNGWFFDKGIEFTFPNISIPANGYLIVTQHEGDFIGQFGGDPNLIVEYGFETTLANAGEKIRLRRSDGTVADAVDYDVGMEWPVTGINGNSIQAIHPDLDRDQAGSWRAAAPTPLAANADVAVASTNNVVVFDRVRHRPKAPSSTSNVVVEIEVPQSVSGLTAALEIQVVTPGNYISISDAEYATTWSSRAMAATTNGTFEVTIPAGESFMQHRNLVRYRVRLAAPGQPDILLPYPEGPEPNFAFFVYDGLGDYGNTDMKAIEQVPVYHLITKAEDAEYYMLVYPRPNQLYPVTGTIVFEDEVYDHIRYRCKGRSERHVRSKRNIRFKSNKGNRMKHRMDEGGDTYGRKNDIVIYGGTLTGRERVKDGGRIDSGLSEGVMYKQFNLFDAAASPADWMHFRVIDEVEENPSTVTNGDFWGIYNILNDYDADFLSDQDLPRDYLYEWKDDGVAVYPTGGPFGFSNPTFTPLTNNVSGTRFAREISGDTAFFRQHFDLERQYRFMACNELIAQNENAYWSKHYQKLYHHPETGWFLFPSDFDGTMMPDDVAIPSQAILRDSMITTNEELRVEFEGVLRDFIDRFLPDDINALEGANLLVEQKALMVDTPGNGTTLAEIDRLRWDLGWTDFDQEKVDIKTFFRDRRQWMLTNYCEDVEIPNQPTITHVSAASYPADDIRFRTSAFSDGSGNADSIEWQVAEITDPNNLPAAGSADWHYEISPTWHSGEMNYEGGQNTLTVPLGVVQAGKMYRARVRHKDDTGRWSHWSAPITFTGAAPAGNPIASLVINEIHYNPVAGPGLEDTEREFIELRNISNTPLDLGGIHLDGGIEYTFPVGASVPPNGYVVLAGRAEEFEFVYGFAPDGDYKNSLSNGGELVQLRDAWGRLIDEVEYGDGNTWGPAADGNGPSLELIDSSSDNNDGDNWLAIGPLGGSPKAPNTVSCVGAGSNPAIVINEINYDSANNADAGDWIELKNISGASVNLNGWKLSDGSNLYTLPNVSIANNGYQVFAEDPALFSTRHPGVNRSGPIGWSFSNGGESLVLIGPDGCLVDIVQYDDDTPWETKADGNGATIALNNATRDNTLAWNWIAGLNGGSPGTDNGFPACGGETAIVINEMNVDSSDFIDVGDWVELLNTSANDWVDLAGWHFYDEGGRFDFPANTFLGPGQFIVVAEDFFAFSSAFPDVPVQVLNGNGFTLRNKGERVLLTTPGGCVVDDIEYDNIAPWPEGLGTGGTLSLIEPNSDNSLPQSWGLGDGLGTPGVANDSPACPEMSQTVILDDASPSANWVDLRNRSGATIDLAGWTLSDNNESHLFPAGTTLANNATIRVSTLNIGNNATLRLNSQRRCPVDQVTLQSGVLNHPPSFTPENVLQFSEGLLNSEFVNAVDVDGDSLTYSLVSGPPGLAINTLGRITWTPGETDGPGRFTATLRVVDARNATDQLVVDIDVVEINRNPSLAAVPNRTIDELSSWSYTLSGSDPDLPAQSLSYHLVSGPAGMTLDNQTLAWTPTEAQGPGTFTVEVEVRDSDGAAAPRSFTLTVDEVNDPPVFPQSTVNVTHDEGVLWLYQVAAQDNDSPVLTYSLGSNAPAGMAIDPATGWIRWLPSFQDGGAVFPVVAYATDDFDNTVSMLIQLDLKNVTTPSVGACTGGETILPFRSTWSYVSGLSGNTWKEPWYDASSWASGAGPFGWSEAGLGTVVPSGFARTTYVKSFNASDVHEVTSITLRFRRDDGAIIYLNGEEVARSNMPAGGVGANTLALSSIFGTFESQIIEMNVPASKLAEGNNVIAVGIHQVAANSNDASFDLELSVERAVDCGDTPEIDADAFDFSGLIQFNTEPGVTYKIQACDDLAGGVWTTLATVTATSSVTQFTDPQANDPGLLTRSYRIER